MNDPNQNCPSKKPLTACFQCRHFYITWDECFPYGCRVLAFKSKTPPAAAVYSASDMACQFFTPKKGKT